MSSMSIYLYLKTHNQTGLKYLGKTIKADPHKYTGSGTYWLHHLKTHGYDYSTEILKECQTEEELKHWGLYYSNLWNIVESEEFANLKEESGDGGKNSTETKIKKSKAKSGSNNPMFGKNRIMSEEAKRKISETLKGRESPNKGRIPWNKGKCKPKPVQIKSKNRCKTLTEEHRSKISEAMKFHKVSEETKKKISQKTKGLPAWNKGVMMTEEQKQKRREKIKIKKLEAEVGFAPTTSRL